MSGRMLPQSTGGTALRLHSCRALSSGPHNHLTSKKKLFEALPLTNQLPVHLRSHSSSPFVPRVLLLNIPLTIIPLPSDPSSPFSLFSPVHSGFPDLLDLRLSALMSGSNSALRSLSRRSHARMLISRAEQNRPERLFRFRISVICVHLRPHSFSPFVPRVLLLNIPLTIIPLPSDPSSPFAPFSPVHSGFAFRSRFSTLLGNGNGSPTVYTFPVEDRSSHELALV
jgi:hypothetical protein